MDSFDQCPLLKMSNNLDFDEEADLVEWASKTKVSIPDKDKTSTIYRETAWVVKNLLGFIKLSKRCPLVFLQAFILSK